MASPPLPSTAPLILWFRRDLRLGDNPGLEAAGWLDDPSSATSLALIPLRAGIAPQAFGLLVLASADQQRFASDMGTDFLERIGEITSAALSRLRPE